LNVVAVGELDEVDALAVGEDEGSEARLPLRRRTRDVLRRLAFLVLPLGDTSGEERVSERSDMVQVLPLAERRETNWRKK
jgi:hypothetical protein